MTDEAAGESRIASRAFRDVAGRFATGVTVVTVNDGGTYRAMTANSFTSVSLDPPLLLICVDLAASMHDPIHEAGLFAVNVLTSQQRPIADLFARRGELTEPMGGVPFNVGGTGSPLLEDTLAWFECEVWREYEGGDHTIYVGRVVDMALLQPDGEPLLFFGARYRAPGDPL
jgi:flavin reductase (DIM6/NTAB) family NADH-FMN oxidoreductase RutF